MAGVFLLTAIAFDATSDTPPVPPGSSVVAMKVAESPPVETTGQFAIPDAKVRGTFHWFDVPADSVAFEGEAPDRVGRVEARGLRTAIAAWWDSGELRIFRSETPRGSSFGCGCRVAMEGEPAAGRMVAEALACMDVPLGLSGLKLRVTRERPLEAPGAITRAIRGMPEPGACAD